jgi:hypothetical protein
MYSDTRAGGSAVVPGYLGRGRKNREVCEIKILPLKSFQSNGTRTFPEVQRVQAAALCGTPPTRIDLGCLSTIVGEMPLPGRTESPGAQQSFAANSDVSGLALRTCSKTS